MSPFFDQDPVISGGFNAKFDHDTYWTPRAQLRCMEKNWCVWNDKPSFSGNLSSISKHTVGILFLWIHHFGSFATSLISYFHIVPISPLIPRFPSKNKVFLFFPCKITLPEANNVTGNTEFGRIPSSFWGFFAISFRCVSCSFRGRFLPTLPSSSHHVT